MAGYLVSDEDLKRISAVLMDYERGLLNRTKPQEETAGQLPVMHIVKVSGAASGGDYPGYLQEYNETTATWTNLGAIVIREVNGAALTTNQRYIGRYAGDVSSGAVYLVLAGGSGGGAILSLDFVTSISCVDGVITPVYSTVCIPGGYICTTTTTTTTAAPTSSTSSTSSTTTTTTTTSSTTSTTTTEAPGGTCTYSWFAGDGVNPADWILTASTCGSGYICCKPDPAAWSPIYFGGATTITIPCVLDNGCGCCLWYTDGSYWQQVNFCTGECNCSMPMESLSPAGRFATTSCQ